MLKKISRVVRKLISGQSVIKLKYSKQDWDRQFAKGKWDFLLQTQQNIVVVKQMLEDVHIEKGKIRVLDVGCGNGALARNLPAADYDYVGTDISAEAIAQAKNNAPQGTFMQSSMDETPKLTGLFDVIIFCEVLLYGDYEKILKTHQPFLKPDGYIIISLYDVWRTRFIWYFLNKQIDIKSHIFVKNRTRNVGWTVKIAKLSKQVN